MLPERQVKHKWMFSVLGEDVISLGGPLQKPPEGLLEVFSVGIQKICVICGAECDI